MGARQFLYPMKGKSYADKVLGYSPTAYWPLWETTGTTAQCLTNAAMNGTYARDVSVMGTMAGIGDGRTAPVFTIANQDLVNIYSVALNAALNGREGSAIVWGKAVNLAQWTNPAINWLLGIQVDGNNRIWLRDGGAAGGINMRYTANGVNDAYSDAAWNDVGWVGYGVTWSDSLDAVSYYVKGAWQETDVAVDTWAGALDNTLCCIGAETTAPTATYWGGGLGHISLFGRPLSRAVMEALTRPT